VCEFPKQGGVNFCPEPLFALGKEMAKKASPITVYILHIVQSQFSVTQDRINDSRASRCMQNSIHRQTQAFSFSILRMLEVVNYCRR